VEDSLAVLLGEGVSDIAEVEDECCRVGVVDAVVEDFAEG